MTPLPLRLALALTCLVGASLAYPSGYGGSEDYSSSGDDGAGSGLELLHRPQHGYTVPGYKPKLRVLGQHVDLHRVPTKVVRITKTVAIKVPVPYPVRVPHNVPYPVPVSKPYPVPVTKIVEVPRLLPVPVHHHYDEHQQQQQEQYADHGAEDSHLRYQHSAPVSVSEDGYSSPIGQHSQVQYQHVSAPEVGQSSAGGASGSYQGDGLQQYRQQQYTYQVEEPAHSRSDFPNAGY